MKVLILLLLASVPAFTQTSPAPQAEPVPTANPEVQYAHFALMFASHEKGVQGMMPLIDRDGHLVYVSVPSVAEAINGGASPIYFPELVALIRNLTQENKRLKEENEKLWALAGKPAEQSSQPVVVVQTPQVQQPQIDEQAVAHQQMRAVLLQRLFGGQPTNMNMNVTYRDCTKYPALCVGH